jgi:hypothetical protein
LFWCAGQHRPVARIDPFPPVNDYAVLRPWDRRGVHNAELFPLIGDNGILAVRFPYTPVGFDSSIVFSPPTGKTIARVREVWSDRDWTDKLTDGNRISFRFDGGCELMAFWAEFE